MKQPHLQSMNSPLRWVGGKKRLRRAIIALLPPHRRYIEPFCGAAWVLFGKPPSEEEVISDKDAELINFFVVLQSQPQAFIDSFRWDLCSRALFNYLRDLDVRSLSPIERAHRFYYLIMAGWGGEFKFPRFQTAVNDGGHGNRLIGALSTLQERIWPAHRRLQSVIIRHLDWQDCLARYDGSDTVAYLDPPYPGNTCNYAENMSAWSLHKTMARHLRDTQCKWVLSSYDHPAVRDLFTGYTFLPVQFFSGMKPQKHASTRLLNREVLITNW